MLLLSRHDPMAASSRLRTFQFIPGLRAAGASVEVAPFFDAVYLRHLYASHGRRRLADVLRAYGRRLRSLLQARRYDVVWIEKEVYPFLPAPFEALLSLSGRPWVVDYDDATFHTYDLHPSAPVRSLLGNKLVPLLAGAATVTVGNSYLESHVRRLGARHVVRLPTVVDIGRYPASPPPEPAPELRVGWIGTPATTKYLEALRGPLLEASRRQPMRLVTIGASPLGDFGVPLEQHPWSVESEARLLAGIHVGVMPLPDEPWERGKCGYKLIQYMATGRPVVASPVGVNGDLVTPEVGLLAADAAQWAAALVQLGSDAAARERMGRAGRALVEREYSLSVAEPRIVRILADAAARPEVGT